MANWVSLRDAIVTETAENLDQQVDKFNAASNGGIVLSSPDRIGDFVDYVMFGANDSVASRDRSAGEGSVTPTEVSQVNNTMISVPGRYGPFFWQAQDPRWQGMADDAVIDMLSMRSAEAIMKFQLNNGIAAAVAALTQAGDAVNDVSATSGLNLQVLNDTHALLGDASGSIACNVMNGAARHKFIGDAIGNSNELFNYGSINVTEFLGTPFIVTDAPALTVSTTDYNVLCLNQGAIMNENQGAPYILMDERYGENITRNFQADFSYDLGLKMFAYGGTANPTPAELATGTNWAKTYESAKNGVGALLVANQS